MYADADQLELARLADDGCPNVPDVDAPAPRPVAPTYSRAEGAREPRHRYAVSRNRGARTVLEC